MNTKRIPATACLLLAVVAVAACGNKKKTAAANTSFHGLSAAVCDAAIRCCDRHELDFIVGPFVDAIDCADRFVQTSTFAQGVAFNLEFLATTVALPNLGAMNEAIKDGRGKIDRAAVAACIAFVDGQPCNTLQEPPDETLNPFCQLPEPVLETPCDPDKLFIGLVREGGECTSPGLSLECEEGLVCRGNQALGVFGRCVRARLIGEPCFVDSECDEDLYCSQLEGSCQAPRKQGETCVYAAREEPSPNPATLLVQCEAGLSCDPITDTCVKPCDRGAGCTIDAQCDETQVLTCILDRCDRLRVESLPCANDGDCEQGLRCTSDPLDVTSLICRLRLDDGELCLQHSDCASAFCNPGTLLCAAMAAAGEPCPSGLDQQCDNGTCEAEPVFCTDNGECPISGLCNLLTNVCSNYCVGLKPDGAMCVMSDECISTACVLGFCRTLPLTDGQMCDDDAQCTSTFCNLDDMRECASLPLALSERCANNGQCESQVCFAEIGVLIPTCRNGLEEGEACGDPDQPPCNPKKYFCDDDAEPRPVCTPLLETGEICENHLQCRGDCDVRFGRLICDDSVDPTVIAVCDGGAVATTNMSIAGGM